MINYHLAPPKTKHFRLIIPLRGPNKTKFKFKPLYHHTGEIMHVIDWRWYCPACGAEGNNWWVWFPGLMNHASKHECNQP